MQMVSAGKDERWSVRSDTVNDKGVMERKKEREKEKEREREKEGEIEMNREAERAMEWV